MKSVHISRSSNRRGPAGKAVALASAWILTRAAHTENRQVGGEAAGVRDGSRDGSRGLKE